MIEVLIGVVIGCVIWQVVWKLIIVRVYGQRIIDWIDRVQKNLTYQKDIGCFGCVFWVAIFVIFCIPMFAAVDAVWNWAF